MKEFPTTGKRKLKKEFNALWNHLESLSLTENDIAKLNDVKLLDTLTKYKTFLMKVMLEVNDITRGIGEAMATSAAIGASIAGVKSVTSEMLKNHEHK